MARSRNVVVHGRSTPRRATTWLASSVETARSNLAAATAVLDQTFAFGEDATIIRVRGSLWVSSDQNAANEEPFGAFGMAVVTDQAAAIGVTAVPTPIADASSDNWFLHFPWLASIRVGDATGFDNNAYIRYDIDNKAMRKVDDGDTVVVVMENSSAGAAVDFLLQFRMLIKQHA